MNNIFDKRISQFTNARSVEPIENLTLEEFLNPDDEVIKMINRVRGADNKEQRDKYKKMLPAATVSGTFIKRNADGLVKYNGIICLDFDQADNPDWTPETIKEHLAAIPEIAYAGTSCSGGGVFALIQTNNTNPALHGRIVDFLRACFLQDGLQIDVACKDVCRLRFVSYDPDPLINPMPEVYDAVSFIERQEAALRQPREHYNHTVAVEQKNKRFEQYLMLIEQRRVDITQIYTTWVLIGLSIASEFGISGLTAFHRVSQFHPRYDPVKTDKKYAELCRSGNGRVSIATFYKFCHENGIRP